MLDDITVSRAIIETYTKKLLDSLEMDVAIAGAGPAGLCAAYYLAQAGRKVAIWERKLSLGGGMWGGGMMFNEIVVGSEGRTILEEFGVRTIEYRDGYHTADAVEAVTTMASKAMHAGARIFNLVSVEDLMVVNEQVEGLVLNWSAVEMAGLHVDPVTVRAKFVVEATGHPLELLDTLVKKNNVRLFTPSGGIEGERSMHAEIGERTVVENTKEVYHNLYVAGMAANAAFGAPRMGPIFGGMLQSGRKVADLILERLSS